MENRYRWLVSRGMLSLFLVVVFVGVFSLAVPARADGNQPTITPQPTPTSTAEPTQPPSPTPDATAGDPAVSGKDTPLDASLGEPPPGYETASEPSMDDSLFADLFTGINGYLVIAIVVVLVIIMVIVISGAVRMRA